MTGGSQAPLSASRSVPIWTQSRAATSSRDGPVADFALAVEKDRSAQRVAGLTLVESGMAAERKIARNRHGRQLRSDSKSASGGVLLGYARVSKGDGQSNAVQAKALRAAGCRRISEEAASGGR
jgi:hypothetical protein